MKDKVVAALHLAKADSRVQVIVREIQSILTEKKADLGSLKDALIALLEHLSSDEGRTDANCNAVDLFFVLDNLWAERNLPAPFHDIFADMAGALHDTVSAPEIAKNFDSTPEQLLERARKLNTEPDSAPITEE